MKYRYTWNHILLFAKICGRIDDRDSVTASWVQITEDHNTQTFPFTMWPLTYRTCEVVTSPAICSPVQIPSDDSVCNYTVKIFKCNEVVIICIQNGTCDNTCDHPCIAEPDDELESEGDDTDVHADHAEHHSCSKTEPLLPCHVAHCYRRIKAMINDAFYEVQENVECVICVGHGASASMASCLASDMSRTYEAEKEFLGLDTRRLTVDYVGFSDSVVASLAYWDKYSSCIEKYISVVFGDSVTAKKPSSDKTGSMVVNPCSSRVTIDELSTTTPTLKRRVSLYQKIIKSNKKENTDSGNTATKPIDAGKDISDYISALTKKINLPLELHHSNLKKIKIQI